MSTKVSPPFDHWDIGPVFIGTFDISINFRVTSHFIRVLIGLKS